MSKNAPKKLVADPCDSDCSINSSEEEYFSDSDSDAEPPPHVKYSDELLYTTMVGVEVEKWASRCKVPGRAVSSLLDILRPHAQKYPKKLELFTSLIKKFNPQDPLDRSEYVYLGISRYLSKYVRPELHPDKLLRLQFYLERQPICKTHGTEFWPVLCKIFETGDFVYKPFVVAIYSGTGKPANLQRYLSPLIQGMNSLSKNGLAIGEEKFSVELMCFICERSIRSVVKCLADASGNSACERCDAKGESGDNGASYSEELGKARSNESFRKKLDAPHHDGNSPLAQLNPPIDMVKQFPLSLIDTALVGAVKKVVCELWMRKRTNEMRENVLRLACRMAKTSFNQVPCEYPASMLQFGKTHEWGEMDMRFFLFHGSVLVKDILPAYYFKHFMLLSVGCRILASDELCFKYLAHARIYLTRFIQLMKNIYGEAADVHVHSLAHLAEDVEHFRCNLGRLTAFPFRNQLQRIKKCIKGGTKVLEQVCRRLEGEFEGEAELVEPLRVKVLDAKKQKNDFEFVTRLQFYGAELRPTYPDNVVMMNDKSVVQIQRMTVSTTGDERIRVYGRTMKILEPSFDYPTCSSALDMYKVEEIKGFNPNLVNEVELKDIKCKMVLLKVHEITGEPHEWHVMPLLYYTYLE